MSTLENRREIEIAVLDAIRALETGNWSLRSFYQCKLSPSAQAEFSYRTFARLVDSKLAEVTGR
jgi:hypothetical protein